MQAGKVLYYSPGLIFILQSYRDCFNFVSVFRYYIYKVGCFQPHRCSVVIRVDSDESAIDKFFVEEEFHFFSLSLSIPSGVTAPGIKPSRLIRSFSDAKLSGRVPCPSLNFSGQRACRP